MEMHEIVDQLDAHIEQLRKVRSLLADTAAPIRQKPGRPLGSGKALPPAKVNAVGAGKVADKPSPARTLSAATRQRIAAAQKARWAKFKAAPKKVARNPVRKTEATAVAKHTNSKTAAPKTAPVKRTISAKKAAIG